jgi:hypothetical protein
MIFFYIFFLSFQAKVRAGQQVAARKQELEQEMDGMIAPFVLIAHHIKGKSDERSYASSVLRYRSVLSNRS